MFIKLFIICNCFFSSSSWSDTRAIPFSSKSVRTKLHYIPCRPITPWHGTKYEAIVPLLCNHLPDLRLYSASQISIKISATLFFIISNGYPQMPQRLESWRASCGCWERSCPVPFQSMMPGRFPVWGSTGYLASVSVVPMKLPGVEVINALDWSAKDGVERQIKEQRKTVEVKRMVFCIALFSWIFL